MRSRDLTHSENMIGDMNNLQAPYDMFRFGNLEIMNNLQASRQLTMKIQPLTVLA